ncbi:hypothetical protein ACFO25_07505 [Paenactinomyces guangxiensis]|nr:hypothetical protein [Paenactinomyces guangxiensis]
MLRRLQQLDQALAQKYVKIFDDPVQTKQQNPLTALIREIYNI